MKDIKNPIARTNDLVVQNSNDEILIYDLIEHRAICMNRTLVAVWGACDGTRSPEEIAAYLSDNEQGTINTDVVHLALMQLSENSLLAENDSFSLLSSNMSRRKLIRNAAIAATIALPVISNLVAPAAASARSACVNPGGLAPNTLVNDFTDNGNCQLFLEGQCCTNAITNYVFTPCCVSPPVGGVGTCTGICT